MEGLSVSSSSPGGMSVPLGGMVAKPLSILSSFGDTMMTGLDGTSFGALALPSVAGTMSTHGSAYTPGAPITNGARASAGRSPSSASGSSSGASGAGAAGGPKEMLLVVDGLLMMGTDAGNAMEGGIGAASGPGMGASGAMVGGVVCEAGAKASSAAESGAGAVIGAWAGAPMGVGIGPGVRELPELVGACAGPEDPDGMFSHEHLWHDCAQKLPPPSMAPRICPMRSVARMCSQCWEE